MVSSPTLRACAALSGSKFRETSVSCWHWVLYGWQLLGSFRSSKISQPQRNKLWPTAPDAVLATVSTDYDCCLVGRWARHQNGRLPRKILQQDMPAKPGAVGELSMAANKNLSIQNSGHGATRKIPRHAPCSGVYLRRDSYSRLSGAREWWTAPGVLDFGRFSKPQRVFETVIGPQAAGSFRADMGSCLRLCAHLIRRGRPTVFSHVTVSYSAYSRRVRT